MNQVLQLGLRAFINPTCFAVTSRNLKIGTLVPLRVRTRAMKSKRPLSSSSKPPSSIDDMEDKKLKGLMGTSPKDNSETCRVIKGKRDEELKAIVSEIANSDKKIHVDGNETKIESIKDDLRSIEAMTVQELRNTLRSIGVPAKGRKSDLVAALKVCLEKKTKDASSHVEVDQVSFISEESMSLKRKANKKGLSVMTKAKNFSTQDQVHKIDSVSEVSELRNSKRKVKQSPIDGETAEFDAEIVTSKQKMSIKTDEISVTLPMDQNEPWTMLAHKKPQKGWIPYNPRTMRLPPLAEDIKSTKLMSWNVNGLRALLKLEGFSALQLAQRENFDVLCLQETKLQEKDVDAIKQCLIDGYENSFWTCSVSKLGYSGTAIISRIKPLSVTYGLGIADHDSEGRLVTAEFGSFFLISTYVPNSGDGLRRLSYRITQWDPSLSSYIKELEKKKPVILTGDLNCAHQEIDIFNPAGNRRSAGFTDEERQSFDSNFLSKGFVDTFRAQHPGVVGYTYWGYRHGGRKTNKGWRLDYFLVSESLADKVHDSYIVPDVTGSDHCPIGLVLKL